MASNADADPVGSAQYINSRIVCDPVALGMI